MRINPEITMDIFEKMVAFIDKMILMTCINMPVDECEIKFWDDERIVRLVKKETKWPFIYKNGYVELIG